MAGRTGPDWTAPTTVTLLSGGNPQIPMGYGEAPVRAWLDAAPGWKGETAARLDALITELVPGVEKAVKWNQPLYAAGTGWFLGMHCLTRYLKIAFFNGAALTPPPPVESKRAGIRYLHIFEGEAPDTAQLADWIRQAARASGIKM